jgi:uncharacterized protein YjiS (DUF1127 family)
MLNKSVSKSAHTIHIYIYIRKYETMTTLVANTFEIVGLNSIANIFKNLGAELKRRKNIKETYKALSNLTTRELDDIGISRGEIWHVAHSSYPKALRGEAVAANRNLRGWV